VIGPYKLVARLHLWNALGVLPFTSGNSARRRLKMPVTILKKPKASKTAMPSHLVHALGDEAMQLASGLDLSNRTTRTPLGWITDGSPSMTGFTQLQLDSAVSMVDELRMIPTTSRSVMMNIVQLGTPSVATGFQQIAKFQVPPLHVARFTPLHTALDLMTNDLGGLCSDLRANGIERTDSVVIITTDGGANDAGPGVLAKSIDAFLSIGKKWSVDKPRGRRGQQAGRSDSQEVAECDSAAAYRGIERGGADAVHSEDREASQRVTSWTEDRVGTAGRNQYFGLRRLLFRWSTKRQASAPARCRRFIDAYFCFLYFASNILAVSG